MDRASASEAENMGSTPVGREYFARPRLAGSARFVKRFPLKHFLSYPWCAGRQSFLPPFRLYKKIK